MALVIVTDVDGSLLDASTYELGPALPVLQRVAQQRIPLVLCSSKTRAEIEALQQRLGIRHPFIPENGGAIVAPPGYFGEASPSVVADGGRFELELGRPYPEVVAALREVAAAERVRIVGFSDMTVGDVAAACGLPELDAQLAKLRQYDEPFRLLDSDSAVRSRFLKALHRRGIRTVSGGRFDHATGDTDKGRAVEILKTLYRRLGDAMVMAGLGDAANDVSLLRAVDRPFIIRSDANGSTGRLLRKVPTARVTTGSGPAGWAEAVTTLLDEPRDAPARQPFWHWPGR
jgi:mannosyl-3-phosphoglycerate phosphatase